MAASNKVYTVEYHLDGYWDKVRSITVLAKNQADAYDKAMYEVIPEIHSYSPYSAWVASVTYQNGNHRRFNNHEGCPYSYC